MSSLERQLFEWNGWDLIESGTFIFYNVKLKCPIGQFPVDAEFHSAIVDYRTSQLHLYPSADETFHTFEMKISI